MAEGLERGKVAEPARRQEYYRFIVQECRRLSAMIENVLDFSRIEQGRKQYELEPTDLQALVQQTVKLLEPYAAERQVTLSLTRPVDWAPTSGASPQPSVDGQAIQQALVNLIDNAVKHSPSGGDVRIGLKFIPVVGEAGDESVHRGTLQLWVEDDGPGIPAAEHERIFERFYRLGSELNRETAGVGIGLSIVKHIVDAHQGRVIVTSEVGKGSRFTIEIPADQQESKT
jgi:signal transduction histidine kinase